MLIGKTARFSEVVAVLHRGAASICGAVNLNKSRDEDFIESRFAIEKGGKRKVETGLHAINPKSGATKRKII